nr:maleylpyruvate isomerase N-terminal domain-containing protein [Rhodococcus sp. (in: high G+C Gram-positive bacteria)]
MGTSDPIGTDDVRALAQAVVEGVVRLRTSAWDSAAGSLSWTRWETAEHLADDLLVYGATLAAPGYGSELPFRTTRRRSGAPDELVHCAEESGSPGLAAVIEAASTLFVAIADVTPPRVIAAHVFGATGAEGFTAMAAVELIVHGHDIFTGTTVDWAPDDELCRRVATRLFPDVTIRREDSRSTNGVSTLLWATGRISLPGRPKRTEWRWYN